MNRQPQRAAVLRADAIVSCVVLALSAAVVYLGGETTAALRTPWWGLLAVLQCGAIVLRRIRPLAALAIAWLGAIVQLIAVQEVGPQNLAALIVLYSSAAYGSKASQCCGAISALFGGVIAGWFIAEVIPAAEGRAPSSILFIAALCVSILLFTWLLGVLRAVSNRAVQERISARVAAEQARHAIAVEEERSRIARDMHDVVAHSLTVMIAQAEGARVVAESTNHTAPIALSHIAETGRSALNEVRDMLAALRQGALDNAQPSLDRLDALIAQLSASGVEIRFSETGDRQPLRPQLDMAVFRIVQESLTNAVRHGSQSQPIMLRVDWLQDRLVIEVINHLAIRSMSELPVARSTTPQILAGHGLIGISERAHHVGGTVTTAARSDQHFVLRAILPYREEHTR